MGAPEQVVEAFSGQVQLGGWRKRGQVAGPKTFDIGPDLLLRLLDLLQARRRAVRSVSEVGERFSDLVALELLQQGLNARQTVSCDQALIDEVLDTGAARDLLIPKVRHRELCRVREPQKRPFKVAFHLASRNQRRGGILKAFGGPDDRLLGFSECVAHSIADADQGFAQDAVDGLFGVLDL